MGHRLWPMNHNCWLTSSYEFQQNFSRIISKIILWFDKVESWCALTLEWHLDCFRIWHFSKIQIFQKFQFFEFFNFDISSFCYSGKEKKKGRDMAQGFNDLLIQPMDDLFRWSSPLNQSFIFIFTPLS